MNIIKYLKFIFNYIWYRPKYKLTGKCKQCGECCRNIIFYAYGLSIKEETVFYELQEKNKRMKLFFPTGKNDKGELLFQCKYLKEDNRCGLYFLRSMYCRKYPMVKSLSTGKYLTPKENCGYKIETEKKFEDFLSK